MMALSGCAGLDRRSGQSLLPSRCLTQAGPYRIWTHQPPPPDDPLIDELRDLERSLDRQLAVRVDPTNSPINIFVLADRGAFDTFLKFYYPELPARRAFFLAKGPTRNVYAYAGPHEVEDLRHEVTHALLHASVADLPLWLDEGLAEYFEVPGSLAGRNAEHLARLRLDLDNGWKPDLARLEQMKDVRAMTARDYRESWAWAHLMLDGTPATRAQLLAYLADLRTAEPDPVSLAERLDAAGSSDVTVLAAHLDRLRESPVVMASSGDRTVLRGQNVTLDESARPAEHLEQGRAKNAPAPRPIAAEPPRRRTIMGRFMGLFGF
jgi:hypothetical protein